MSRQVALVIAGVAGLVALALVIHLWRWTRSHRGKWGPAESLAALGLLVSLVSVAVPLIFTSGQSGETGESREVTSYRQRVTSACASLQASTNPVAAAMGAGGEIDRDRLQQGMRAQLTAAKGVLDGLWSVNPPAVLADKVVLARSDADAFIRASSAALDRMPRTLPRSMTFQDFAQFAGEFDAQLRPKGSAMEASMSELAGGPCSPPSPAGT
ncbi:MAG TPA: hypothetical protein VFJ22_10540 [Dermatophilaceae bacterium]|jgi:hypothetical protein|nr:hypothetical protein [Dermatophilaceae bacterium]